CSAACFSSGTSSTMRAAIRSSTRATWRLIESALAPLARYRSRLRQSRVCSLRRSATASSTRQSRQRPFRTAELSTWFPHRLQGRGSPGLSPFQPAGGGRRSFSARRVPHPLLELAGPPAVRWGCHLDVVLAQALDASVRRPIPDHLERPAIEPCVVGGAQPTTELDCPPRSVPGFKRGHGVLVASRGGPGPRREAEYVQAAECSSFDRVQGAFEGVSGLAG